jgi:hypothetical protein
MASVSACGADFMKSRLRLGMVAEHAVSMKPHAIMAMTRLIIAFPDTATPKGPTRYQVSLLP